MSDYIAHYGVLGMKWGVRNAETRARYNRDKKNESVKHLKGYSGPAYFVSENKNLSTLNPRVPKNYFTENGYEDSSTPRVCFAPSVEKCLAGLSQNVEGKTYTVYKPKDITGHKVLKPNEKAVPDSKITGELWVCDPVDVVKVGEIKVTGNNGKSGKKFRYGDKQAELFDDWQYEFTKKEVPYSDKHMEGHMRFNAKNGDQLELRRIKNSTVSKVLSQINPNVKKQIDNCSDFKVYSNGKRIGSLSLKQDDETTLNGVWVSVKEKHRGKGYGQAIVDNAIQYAAESGNKKFTLEVPGSSPDARHIYEKYGAVEVGTLSEDDIWGGLTNMEIDLTKKVNTIKR